MSEVEWFRRFPTGGTVYARPSGNPYASVEDAEARSVVTVELPEVEDGVENGDK